MKLSETDLEVLREIQRDTTLSLAALAEKLGMSQSTLWRRMNEFESAGVIARRVAILDPAKLDTKLCVLAMVTLEDHSEEAVADFSRLVEIHPEILECHKISGAADYILKIRARDVEAYEYFQTHFLLRNPWVRSVQSSFVLKEVKATTALPI